LPRDLINVARPIGPRFDMGVYEMFVTIYLPVILR
jgi:hypothetical protein